MPIQPGDPMLCNLGFFGADEPGVTTYVRSSTTDAFFDLSALSPPDTSGSIGLIYVLKMLESHCCKYAHDWSEHEHQSHITPVK